VGGGRTLSVNEVCGLKFARGWAVSIVWQTSALPLEDSTEQVANHGEVSEDRRRVGMHAVGI
jgi:hypothetical protein